MSERDTTYIERIALEIWWETGGDGYYPTEEESLWLGYAVLCLSKDEWTTSRDVHDAWSAWAQVYYNGSPPSLVPFDELTPEVQAYDDEYRDAIHSVAQRRMTAEYLVSIDQRPEGEQ